ncbi:MAG: hypothetical protein JW983_09885 [Elusimicrobia bacterium]|nr:hypothetical protein [Elusimicrobiota bacterium]
MSEDQVILLGKEIDKDTFPKVYAWGKTNPVILEIIIRKMMKERFPNKFIEAITALEKTLNFEEILLLTGHK